MIPQLVGALLHRCDPDAGPVVARETVPVIRDLELEGAVHGDPNPAGAGVRMSRHVRHRLQRDPVRGDLDGGRKAVKVLRRVHLDANVLTDSESFRLLTQRPDEPELVEGGRAQGVHEPANVRDRVLNLGAGVREEVRRRRGIRAQ